MANDQLKEAVEVINSEVVIPPYTNHFGTIFGGKVLELMDITGAMAAMRFSNQDAVTASIDAVDFRKPIHLGDIIELRGKVIHTARTSMVVKVDNGHLPWQHRFSRRCSPPSVGCSTGWG